MAFSFQDDETKNIEKVWQESGFFDDHRSDLTIQKANFPEMLYAMSVKAQFRFSRVVVK